MPNTPSDSKDFGHWTEAHALRRAMLLLGGVVLVFVVSMFLAAGRLGWTRGWFFLLISLLLAILSIAYLWRTNPEVVIARTRFHQGTKRWDEVMVFLVIVSFMAILVTAAIDDGRFHWSVVPLWVTVVGYVLLFIGIAADVWGKSVNKFAEWTVRIQTERKQEVVDAGPYAIVRHPLHAASFFLLGGIPLALGSFWALIPAVVTASALIVRTALEDRMLYNELEGYREYANRVRYRLIPGIW
ncbi:MAG: isoprenylcysteine carboxylmethyltransferase family protein [Thermoguttaceae bacterium]